MAQVKVSANVEILSSFPSWKLEEAKARFSELVKKAKDGPQRVTLHGRDAVMVVDATEFAKLLPASSSSLYDLMAASPLAEVEFEHKGVRSPVRKVAL